jgi:DNA-binding GntR family transcriptional regulator
MTLMSKEKNNHGVSYQTGKRRPLLDRVNLPVRVCDILRSRIVANEISFGAKLTEDSLAKEFGISRTPIREAFNRLAQEGLVSVFPGRGAFVATLSFTDMVQLLQIREALEGMAARLATNHVAKTGLEKWRRQMEIEFQNGGGRKYRGYSDVDRRFHEFVIAASGNHHLTQLMKSLRDRIQMLRYRSVILPGRARKSYQEHLRIIDALAARDSDLAEERMRAHIRKVKADLTASMSADLKNEAKDHEIEYSKNGKKSRGRSTS